ncbi:MAG: TrkA family potassium uptake protein [Dehalococcoidia bacterium]|nr:TrkA family potassium uptake protein [Dehalococcoidia bacterium]
MYAVIVGCGRMGFNLARALLEQGHEVTVTERDLERSKVANEQLGQVVVVGDGCEPQVLREAGAQRADVLVALTGKDEDNLVACQVAKHLFRVSRTIALVNNPKNEKLFHLLGVDVQLSHTSMVLQHVEEELPGAGVVHMEGLRGSNWELVSIKIPSDAMAVGKPLREMRLPQGSVVSLVIGADGLAHFPSENILLHTGDQLLVVTSPESEETVRETLTGVN